MSRDFFGADASPSESTTSAPPPSPAAVAAATAPSTVPAPAPGTPAPTLAQAVDKAVKKAEADVKVAVDPHATHHAVLTPTAPTALGGGAAGAGIGFMFGGPIGAGVGGLVGWALERYQVAGGPVTVVKNKIASLRHKK